MKRCMWWYNIHVWWRWHFCLGTGVPRHSAGTYRSQCACTSNRSRELYYSYYIFLWLVTELFRTIDVGSTSKGSNIYIYVQVATALLVAGSTLTFPFTSTSLYSSVVQSAANLRLVPINAHVTWWNAVQLIKFKQAMVAQTKTKHYYSPHNLAKRASFIT